MSSKRLSSVQILDLLGRPRQDQNDAEYKLANGQLWLHTLNRGDPSEILDLNAFTASEAFPATLIIVAALTEAMKESDGNAKLSYIRARSGWLKHLQKLLTPAAFAVLTAEPTPTMIRNAALREQGRASDQAKERSDEQLPNSSAESIRRRAELRAAKKSGSPAIARGESEDGKQEQISAPVLVGPAAIASNPGTAKILAEYDLLSSPVRRVKMPNLTSLSHSLKAKYPWFSEFIESLTRDLSVSILQGRPYFSMSPVLLVGRPGCGKTAIAEAIAKAAGTPSHLFHGSMCDGEDFSGHGRRFHNGTPSFVLRKILSTQIANPVVIIDEIDKLATREIPGEEILDSLLGLLEPSTALRWRDPFLERDCDLSTVSWILIANDASRLPPALISRVRIYNLPRPTTQHLDSIISFNETQMSGADTLSQGQLALDSMVRKLLAADLDQHGDLRRVRRALRAALGVMPRSILH